jgi:hypothetical protein
MTRSLAAATQHFVARYAAAPVLVAEQAGWTLTIALSASDTEEAVGVRVEDGRVVEVGPLREPGQLTVVAGAETLIDVLELKRSPNEAYVFGELVVRGQEADFVRLDYVASALCLP